MTANFNATDANGKLSLPMIITPVFVLRSNCSVFLTALFTVIVRYHNTLLG